MPNEAQLSLVRFMERLISLVGALAFPVVTSLLAAEQPKQAQNPIIQADVPDIAMIRVGDTYYMSSTTMHMSPGLPIMKSKDLVNWELVSYAYRCFHLGEQISTAGLTETAHSVSWNYTGRLTAFATGKNCEWRPPNW